VAVAFVMTLAEALLTLVMVRLLWRLVLRVAGQPGPLQPGPGRG
jgi:hypothetical protein